MRSPSVTDCGDDGERLDRCSQQKLAANLARLLCSDSICTTFSARDRVRVFITVQQFDVDTRGHGILIARWRISMPESESSLKSGRTQLARMGPAPRGNPGAIAATLSDLMGEFSREPAQALQESTSSGLLGRR